jgi:hypothetical protein
LRRLKVELGGAACSRPLPHRAGWFDLDPMAELYS